MKSIQYTLRDIPETVDRALRARARTETRSLNSVAVEILSAELASPEKRCVHDLDEFAGTWVKDPAFDAALADMDKIDTDLWS